jgi:hypothetical protein
MNCEEACLMRTGSSVYSIGWAKRSRVRKGGMVERMPEKKFPCGTAEVVMQLFEQLAGQGKTILMVTHDNTLANRTHRKLVISDGELIREALSTRYEGLDHSSICSIRPGIFSWLPESLFQGFLKENTSDWSRPGRCGLKIIPAWNSSPAIPLRFRCPVMPSSSRTAASRRRCWSFPGNWSPIWRVQITRKKPIRF